MTDNRIFKLDLERQSEIIDCTLETLGAIRLSGPVGLITVLCAKSRLRDLFGGSQLPRPSATHQLNKKALIAGRTLYLPIDFALFSVG